MEEEADEESDGVGEPSSLPLNSVVRVEVVDAPEVLREEARSE
jgi:hypothetical protein